MHAGHPYYVDHSSRPSALAPLPEGSLGEHEVKSPDASSEPDLVDAPVADPVRVITAQEILSHRLATDAARLMDSMGAGVSRRTPLQDLEDRITSSPLYPLQASKTKSPLILVPSREDPKNPWRFIERIPLSELPDWDRRSNVRPQYTPGGTVRQTDGYLDA